MSIKVKQNKPPSLSNIQPKKIKEEEKEQAQVYYEENQEKSECQGKKGS
jgi:hypothetical protein